MKTLIVNRNIIVSIFAVILLMCGLPGVSYGEVLLTEPNSEMEALLLYWTEDAGSSSTIRRMNLINGQVQDVVTGLGSLPPSDIAVDASGRKVYWSDDFLADRIQRANLDGTDRQDVVGELSPTGIALDVSGGKIYWADNWDDKIQRADLNGANVQDVVTGLQDPIDVALDVSGGKIYWTDGRGNKIQRADLDGTNVQDVVTGLRDPTYIALDASGGKIYWVDDGPGKIQQANLDGTDIRDVVTGFIWSTGIALDVLGGKIYWTNTVEEKIQRADLNGTNVQDVITGLEISTLFPAITFAAIPHKTTINFSPSSAPSPVVEEELELSLNITAGEAVAGYQATVHFDSTALSYVESSNGEYLPEGAFFVSPVVDGNRVTLNATSLSEESNGDGTLATLTFKVVAVKASTVTLSNVLLTNSAGEGSHPQVEGAQITQAGQSPESDQLKADVNGDGIVNIQDLALVASRAEQTGQNAADVNDDEVVNNADLLLVAGALGNAPAAPSLDPRSLEMFTATEVKQWLSEAQHLNLTDARLQRGILFLQQLLAMLLPKETALLANYPNPFNPETWIPYQLAKDADVTLHIYAVNGTLVRTLALGHQAAGIYQNRSRAVYLGRQKRAR